MESWFTAWTSHEMHVMSIFCGSGETVKHGGDTFDMPRPRCLCQKVSQDNVKTCLLGKVTEQQELRYLCHPSAEVIVVSAPKPCNSPA